MQKRETPNQTLDEIKRKLRNKLEQYIARNPHYKLNPDEEIVSCVIEGLAHSELKHGFAYCTCKVPVGIEAEDKKIICPCHSLAKEIERWGHCDCALIVGPKSEI